MDRSFHNAINYGKKEDTGFIKIELNSEKVEGVDYLTLKMINPVDYENVLAKGSNQGLASLKSLLEKLNYNEEVERIPSLETGLEGEAASHYATKIYFQQKLLLKRLQE